LAHLLGAAVSFLTVRVSGVNPLLLVDLPAGFLKVFFETPLLRSSAGSIEMRD
jgi:hypothetical protein